MKILFFSPYYFPYISGLTIYPKRVLDHLSKKHQVTVLTFNHLNNLLKIENGKLKIIRLSYWFKISKGYIAPISILEFWRQVRSNDLLLLNQPNFEGFMLAVFGRIFRKKIVSIVHCQVFLPISFFNIIINVFLNLSFYIQLALSNAIIPTSKDYANSLLFGRLFKNKIYPVFPPILTPTTSLHYINIMKQRKGQDIWIGFVGRIAAEKGIEILIQSINQLSQKIKKIKLVIAGPDPKTVSGEKNYWLKINQQLNLRKTNFLFLNNLTDEELTAFYKTVNVLVIPSVNQTEALGMTQIEAMFTGTSVIASDLPGVRVPIKLTKMGLLVKPKNSKQLAGAILEILKNKNRFTNLKLIDQAKKIFDPKKTYQFYDQLLDEKN